MERHSRIEIKLHTDLRAIRARAATASVMVMLAFMVLLNGCSEPKKKGSSSTQPTTRGPNNNNTDAQIAPLGECNKFSLSSIGLNGYVSTYYDRFTGQVRSDYLNLILTSVPSQVLNSEDYQIQFLRWTISGNAEDLNQIPVRMHFIDRRTGNPYPLGLNNTTVIKRSGITNLITANSLDKVGFTVDNFFSKTMIVLTGIEDKYQAGRFYLLQGTTSTTAASSGSILLPPFYSNPQTFATYSPDSRLTSLHPLNGQSGLGGTDRDYSSLISVFCAEMVRTGDRTIASIGPNVDLESESTQPGFLARAWAFIKSLF
jgi:hypothetical protein